MKRTVSVILCSHNRAGHLEGTLRSLRDVRVPERWTAELILVDNASTDTTPEVMRAFDHPEMEVRVVREEKKGLSNARNRGVEEAQGQVLLFTDDDVRFPSDWIEEMGRPILQGAADGVAGGVELAEEIKGEWMTVRHRGLMASTEQIDPEEPERIVGANMAIARKVFAVIPEFDPALGAGKLGKGEEQLFSWQMRRAGFQIETAFDVVVEHHPDPSRLSRQGFRTTAKEIGRAEAYINYHWRGHTGWSRATLAAGLVYWAAKLAWWRLCNVQRIQSEGMSLEEIGILKRLYRTRQHLREKGHRPRYAQEESSQKDEA